MRNTVLCSRNFVFLGPVQVRIRLYASKHTGRTLKGPLGETHDYIMIRPPAADLLLSIVKIHGRVAHPATIETPGKDVQRLLPIRSMIQCSKGGSTSSDTLWGPWTEAQSVHVKGEWCKTAQFGISSCSLICYNFAKVQCFA